MNKELPNSLKITIAWLLLGTGVFLGFQWWEHSRQQMLIRADSGVIEIRRNIDGHYHWPGTINGRAVDFLIDTGATATAMSTALARELGLPSVGTVRSHTAGGVVAGDVVLANVTLKGGVSAERLRVTALPDLGERPLLGMNVLGRLSWRQRDGVLMIDLDGGK